MEAIRLSLQPAAPENTEEMDVEAAILASQVQQAFVTAAAQVNSILAPASPSRTVPDVIETRKQRSNSRNSGRSSRTPSIHLDVEAAIKASQVQHAFISASEPVQSPVSSSPTRTTLDVANVRKHRSNSMSSARRALSKTPSIHSPQRAGIQGNSSVVGSAPQINTGPGSRPASFQLPSNGSIRKASVDGKGVAGSPSETQAVSPSDAFSRRASSVSEIVTPSREGTFSSHSPFQPKMHLEMARRAILEPTETVAGQEKLESPLFNYRSDSDSLVGSSKNIIEPEQQNVLPLASIQPTSDSNIQNQTDTSMDQKTALVDVDIEAE